MSKWWPFKILGYEKFWLALLAGNSQQIPILFCLVVIFNITGVPAYAQTPAVIMAAVALFWSNLWSAFGALLGTNTPPAGTTATTTITQHETTTTEAGTTTVEAPTPTQGVDG